MSVKRRLCQARPTVRRNHVDRHPHHLHRSLHRFGNRVHGGVCCQWKDDETMNDDESKPTNDEAVVIIDGEKSQQSKSAKNGYCCARSVMRWRE